MQRARSRVLIVFTIILLVFSFTGCANNKHPLSPPTDLEINTRQQKIYWKQVQGATGYIVDTGSKKYKVRSNSFDLEILGDGNYEVRVKAISRAFKESAYSKILHITISKSALLNFSNTKSVKEYQLIGIGRNTDKTLQIPNNHNGIPITSIGTGAFENNQRIREVILGENIKKIYASAFRGASNLTKVKFNQRLKEIGESAFEDCKSLREVEFNNEVTKISKRAFKGCTSIKSVYLPDGIKKIEESLFEDSGIEEMRIPNSVEEIGEHAFARTTKLQTLELGENVSKIADYAFYETKELAELVANSKLETIGKSAFEKAEHLSRLLWNNGLKAIGQDAFKGCVNLLQANTPESIEYIGKDAFHQTAIVNNQSTLAYVDKWLVGTNDENATEVIAKEGTLGIIEYAFFDNKKIKKFVTSTTMKYIGISSFEGCSEVNSASITNVTRIGDKAFKNCTALNIGSLPNELESIGEDAFLNTLNYKNSTTSVMVGNWIVGHKIKAISDLTPEDSVVGIADFAFKNRDNIRKITFGSNFKYIGRGAFFGNQKLKEVSIPDTVLDIGEYAFAQAAELFKVKLSNNMREIKDSIFYESGKLSEVILGNSLERIGNYSFYRTAIEKIELPSTVKSIGKAAFYENKKLSVAKLEGDLENIGDFAFYANTSLEKVFLGNKLKGIGSYAFYATHLLKKIEFKEGLENIGNYAFAETKNLQSITLPSTTKRIGERAFEKSTALEKIDLGGTSEIGDYAFAFCSQLKSILITKKQKKLGEHVFADIDPTIYMEKGVDEKEFDIAWNSGNSVIISNCDDNKIEKKEGIIRNYNQYKTISPLVMPKRKLKMYIDSSSGKAIEPQDLAKVKDGIVLELVWE